MGWFWGRPINPRRVLPEGFERLDGVVVPRAEYEAEMRIREAVKRRLAKPPRRPHRLAEHSPWDERTQTCLRCGVTVKAFHSAAYGYGLPCSTAAPADPTPANAPEREREK